MEYNHILRINSEVIKTLQVNAQEAAWTCENAQKTSSEQDLARHRMILLAITSGCSSCPLENDRRHGNGLVLELEAPNSSLHLLVSLRTIKIKNQN